MYKISRNNRIRITVEGVQRLLHGIDAAYDGAAVPDSATIPRTSHLVDTLPVEICVKLV